jgi:hypothetical protein
MIEVGEKEIIVSAADGIAREVCRINVWERVDPSKSLPKKNCEGATFLAND